MMTPKAYILICIACISIVDLCHAQPVSNNPSPPHTPATLAHQDADQQIFQILSDQHHEKVNEKRATETGLPTSPVLDDDRKVTNSTSACADSTIPRAGTLENIEAKVEDVMKQIGKGFKSTVEKINSTIWPKLHPHSRESQSTETENEIPFVILSDSNDNNAPEKQKSANSPVNKMNEFMKSTNMNNDCNNFPSKLKSNMFKDVAALTKTMKEFHRSLLKSPLMANKNQPTFQVSYDMNGDGNFKPLSEDDIRNIEEKSKAPLNDAGNLKDQDQGNVDNKKDADGASSPKSMDQEPNGEVESRFVFGKKKEPIHHHHHHYHQHPVPVVPHYPIHPVPHQQPFPQVPQYPIHPIPHHRPFPQVPQYPIHPIHHPEPLPQYPVQPAYYPTHPTSHPCGPNVHGHYQSQHQHQHFGKYPFKGRAEEVAVQDPSLNTFDPKAVQDSSLNIFYPKAVQDVSLNTFIPKAVQDSSLNNFDPKAVQDLSLNTFVPKAVQDSSLNTFYPKAVQDSSLNTFYPKAVQDSLSALVPNARTNTEYTENILNALAMDPKIIEALFNPTGRTCLTSHLTHPYLYPGKRQAEPDADETQTDDANVSNDDSNPLDSQKDVDLIVSPIDENGDFGADQNQGTKKGDENIWNQTGDLVVKLARMGSDTNTEMKPSDLLEKILSALGQVESYTSKVRQMMKLDPTIRANGEILRSTNGDSGDEMEDGTGLIKGKLLQPLLKSTKDIIKNLEKSRDEKSNPDSKAMINQTSELVGSVAQVVDYSDGDGNHRVPGITDSSGRVLPPAIDMVSTILRTLTDIKPPNSAAIEKRDMYQQQPQEYYLNIVSPPLGYTNNYANQLSGSQSNNSPSNLKKPGFVYAY